MPTGDAFDLPAQALALALLAFCQATGSEILVPADRLDGRVSSPVTGACTPQEALTALLRGTGCAGEIRERIVLMRCGPAKNWTGV